MLKPLNDNVLVKPIEEEINESGIIVPDNVAKEKPGRGEVISVGPGRMVDNGTRLEMTVKKGDVVIFIKYSPNELKIGGEDFLMLNESGILGVIEK